MQILFIKGNNLYDILIKILTSAALGNIIYLATSGRSSVWLERYLGVVEVARSNRVAPTNFFYLGIKAKVEAVLISRCLKK